MKIKVDFITRKGRGTDWGAAIIACVYTKACVTSSRQITEGPLKDVVWVPILPGQAPLSRSARPKQQSLRGSVAVGRDGALSGPRCTPSPPESPRTRTHRSMHTDGPSSQEIPKQRTLQGVVEIPSAIYFCSPFHTCRRTSTWTTEKPSP